MSGNRRRKIIGLMVLGGVLSAALTGGLWYLMAGSPGAEKAARPGASGPRPASVRVRPVDFARNSTVFLSGVVREYPGGVHRVRLEAAEAIRASVRRGDSVMIQLPLMGLSRVYGRVAAKPAGALTVRFQFPPRVVDAMLVRVRLRLRGGKLARVPLRAVSSPSGDEVFVWRVSAGRLDKTVVQVVGGLPRGESILVAGDFKRGDRVAVSGFAHLTQGEKVIVENDGGIQ